MHTSFTYDYTSHFVRLAYLFTGKERDSESGLDYFPARSYSSNMGRWMSPDPSGLYLADPANPQQLNLYAYVGNNPLAFTDPLGLSSDCDGKPDASVVCIVTTAFDWLKNHLGGGGGGGSNTPDQTPGAATAPDPGQNQYPGVNPARFRTVQEAGIAASRQGITQTLQRDYTGGCAAGCMYEWGGRLVRDRNGKFGFTNPVTFKDPGNFWTSHVMIPFGYRNAGRYHTHRKRLVLAVAL